MHYRLDCSDGRRNHSGLAHHSVDKWVFCKYRPLSVPEQLHLLVHLVVTVGALFSTLVSPLLSLALLFPRSSVSSDLPSFPLCLSSSLLFPSICVAILQPWSLPLTLHFPIWLDLITFPVPITLVFRLLLCSWLIRVLLWLPGSSTSLVWVPTWDYSLVTCNHWFPLLITYFLFPLFLLPLSNLTNSSIKLFPISTRWLE